MKNMINDFNKILIIIVMILNHYYTIYQIIIILKSKNIISIFNIIQNILYHNNKCSNYKLLNIHKCHYIKYICLSLKLFNKFNYDINNLIKENKINQFTLQNYYYTVLIIL